MSKNGPDTLKARCAAWQKLGRLDLDDSKKFHKEIYEPRWHSEQKKPSGKPNLQSTWRRLIAATLGFEGKEAGEEDQWLYQREHWGRHGGKTCVIELSGLAAHSLIVKRERDEFLNTRIRNVVEKMNINKPSFLILYGKTVGCEKAWANFASCSEAVSSRLSIMQIRRRGDTVIAWTGHPTMQKVTDWCEVGYELKRLDHRVA
ncbi:MAG: hypothetical protein WB439_00040 [Acidobacteriaceae bacterium]